MMGVPIMVRNELEETAVVAGCFVWSTFELHMVPHFPLASK
jgi:hypothetical protein